MVFWENHFCVTSTYRILFTLCGFGLNAKEIKQIVFCVLLLSTIWSTHTPGSCLIFRIDYLTAILYSFTAFRFFLNWACVLLFSTFSSFVLRRAANKFRFGLDNFRTSWSLISRINFRFNRIFHKLSFCFSWNWLIRYQVTALLIGNNFLSRLIRFLIFHDCLLRWFLNHCSLSLFFFLVLWALFLLRLRLLSTAVSFTERCICGSFLIPIFRRRWYFSNRWSRV